MNDDLKCIIYTTFERYNKIERICVLSYMNTYISAREEDCT